MEIIHMKVFKIINGKIESNIYIVTVKHDTYIIDPGFDYNGVFRYVKENGLKIKAVLLTHGHYDHCSAVDKIVKEYNCPVYMDLDDMIFIDDLSNNPRLIKNMATKIESKIQDIHSIKDDNYSVYKTPGHSLGGIIIKFKGENSLFVGDTIFKASIGRADLPGSSPQMLNSSLRLILSFPAKTILYPGHGENTTVDHELKYNPFIK
jgi:hydroxyacylglutathione hydrolase